jgi:hypothetical protein
MEVGNGRGSFRRLWLAAGLYLAMGAPAVADPLYSAIDLGTGNLTYGVDSSRNGTVTGSTGLTYTFDPVQNSLPAKWTNTTQGVPIVEPAPVGSPDTYGNPNFAFSNSTLSFMNSQGRAAGINLYGVDGHMGSAEAFLTQQQSNGSWGAPIPLWAGASNFAGSGNFNVGIMGVSPTGQVLGFGASNPNGLSYNVLYLYDTKTQSLTNLTSLVNSLNWTTAAQLPMGQNSNWILSSVVSQLDNQGRILVQATEGLSGPAHNLLLIPEGLSSGPVATPEPSTWAVFATMIGGWMIRRRLRARPRS